jgi:type I restriction enzyme S subunit
METQIPKGWRQVALRSVCEPTRIWNPLREPRDEFWYVDVSAVSRESLAIQAPQKVKAAQAPSRARKIIQTGDAIFATVRPTLRRIAFVEKQYDNQIASTAFCIVRANRQEAVPRFLYYALQTEFFNEEVAKFQSGASYPAVNDKDVLNQIIALPLSPEQEKIAAVLWTIQRAIEVEAKLSANARELKQSAMRQLFTLGLRNERQRETEIGLIPKSWRIVECDSICEMITVGIVVKPASHYVDNAVPAFRSLNIREDRLDTNKIVFISKKANDTILSKSKLRTDDVLVVRTGYPGTSCVVPPEYNGANCIDLVIVRPKQNIVLSAFLSRFFNSESGCSQALRSSTGLAQQHLNVGAVKRTLIPIPAIAEQKEIAAILQTIDRKISVHERKRAALSDLFQTMLHQLMTAQIRVDKLDIDTSEVENLAGK